MGFKDHQESAETLQGNIRETYSESSEDPITKSEYRTPFLIFFGITCALIGAIAYKWAAALL